MLGTMDKIEELAQAGDELRALIGRALEEFMVGSDGEALKMLDLDGFRLCRRWDQLRGRPVPSDAELAEGRRQLEALAKSLEG